MKTKKLNSKLQQHRKQFTVIHSYYVQGTVIGALLGVSHPVLLASQCVLPLSTSSVREVSDLLRQQSMAVAKLGFELFCPLYVISWSSLSLLLGDHAWCWFLTWHFIPLYSMVAPELTTYSLPCPSLL